MLPVPTISPTRVTFRDGLPEKPTIVFIHGVYHGSWAFEGFSQPFTQLGYRVALIDLPGHWGTERLTPQSDVGYSHLVAEMETELERISGPKILIGHSLGGLLAMSLQTRPDILGAVLMATPLPQAIRTKQWKLLVEFPILTIRFLITGNPDALYHDERFTDRYFFSAHTPNDVKASANLKIQKQHEPRRLFSELMSLKFDELETQKPTLIILGSDDPTATEDVGNQLQTLVRGDIVIIDQAGHDIMLEESADKAVDSIFAWLSQF